VQSAIAIVNILDTEIIFKRWSARNTIY